MHIEQLGACRPFREAHMYVVPDHMYVAPDHMLLLYSIGSHSSTSPEDAVFSRDSSILDAPHLKGPVKSDNAC